MSKQFWTVSALSVELGMDRRTLAKRLAKVEPAKIDGDNRFYWMKDVFTILREHRVEQELKRDELVSAFRNQAIDWCRDFWLQLASKTAGTKTLMLVGHYGLTPKQAWAAIAAAHIIEMTVAERLLDRPDMDITSIGCMQKMETAEGRAELERWTGQNLSPI